MHHRRTVENEDRYVCARARNCRGWLFILRAGLEASALSGFVLIAGVLWFASVRTEFTKQNTPVVKKLKRTDRSILPGL